MPWYSIFVPAGVILPEGPDYPSFSDWGLAVGIAVFFLAFQWVLNVLLFVPMAVNLLPPSLKRRLGHKDSLREQDDKRILESAFQQQPNHKPEQIKVLSNECGMAVKDVSSWFHKRRELCRGEKTLGKWKETAWRALYYWFMVIFAFAVFSETEWLFTAAPVWRGYPYHKVTPAVRLYVMGQLGFYLHATYRLLVDEKKKDFKVMLSHHVITVIKISMSYLLGFHRIGIVILLNHDVADPFLETAKLFKYIGLQKLCDATFAIFALVFFVSRLVYMPIHTLWSGFVVAYREVGFFGLDVFLGALLMVLQFMHVYWFSIIAKMIYKAVVLGKVEKDARSEDDESEEPNEDTEAAPLVEEDGLRKRK